MATLQPANEDGLAPWRGSFKLANIQKPDKTPKRCHSHMFRDTFAVELLWAEVPIDQVSLVNVAVEFKSTHHVM